jgi:hypothetical protein
MCNGPYSLEEWIFFAQTGLFLRCRGEIRDKLREIFFALGVAKYRFGSYIVTTASKRGR